MGVSVTAKVVDRTSDVLQRIKGATQEQLQAFGEEFQELAMENTNNFKGHQNPDPRKRPTGNLKRSIRLEMLQFGFVLYTETGYGAWVELGTTKMAAQPYFTPAYEESNANFSNSGPWV